METSTFNLFECILAHGKFNLELIRTHLGTWKLQSSTYSNASWHMETSIFNLFECIFGTSKLQPSTCLNASWHMETSTLNLFECILAHGKFNLELIRMHLGTSKIQS